MTSNRREVRAALAAFLQQAGINSVYQSFPTAEISDFPAAIITVPEWKETVISGGGPGMGRKRIDCVPVVQIWALSESGDGVTDALSFDDLLDSIDRQIRSDPTLGGQVLAAGVQYIDTVQPDPTSDSEGTLVFVAEKKFDVRIEFTW